MTNITYLQEDPPSYQNHTQNLTYDENQNLTDTESYDESLPELPPYDNTEADLFLEQSILKKKSVLKIHNIVYFL